MIVARPVVRGRARLIPEYWPTWQWNFVQNGIPGGATYTGSGGTFVGSNGLIQSATTNVPRFDYDPATLSPLGYLAEMASTNLCIRSAELDNASWTKTRSSVTANATTSPDGTANADKIVEDSSAGTSHYAASAAIALTNVSCEASAFVKAAERTACRIEFAGGAGTFGSSFNLSTGAAVSTDANTTASIRAFGNGWYRISVRATWPSSSNCNIFIFPQAVAGTNSYNGDGTSGIYAWGAQLEAGGVGVTSYIPTAGATASRTQDVLSLPLTSLPGWSATQGGVLVAAYRLHTTAPGDNQIPACIDDGTAGNRVLPKASRAATGVRGYTISSGSSNQFDQDAASGTSAFARTKLAVGWGTARGQLYADGALLVATSAAASLPVAPTTIRLGNSTTTGNLNGTLESIAYYRGARSDAFVQAVSR